MSTLGDGPLLWYLNRGTGIVLLVLFTATVLLGILATRRSAGGLVPAFVSQHLHRHLSVLSLVLLVAHVASAVADTYVDIRWWQALVPWGATYEPLWFELGVVTVDLGLLIALSSVLRRRLPPRLWRAVHLSAYAGWAAAVAHTWGIGTDTAAGAAPWGRWVVAGCVGSVLAATAWRLVPAPDPAHRPAADTPAPAVTR